MPSPNESWSDGAGGRSGGWLGGLALVALCLLALMPGLRDLPPVDRDESRFAQASRQMLESGTLEGWVVPRVGDRPRLNKPPLIYWLQSASASLFGSENPDAERNPLRLPTGNIWPFRLPSVLCAILAALLTWRLGLSMFPRDPRVGWLAGAMLACSVMVMWDARQARADQLLLAVTTASMWALWECWKRLGATASGASLRAQSAVAGALDRPPRPTPSRTQSLAVAPLALWLLVALGVMSKGPITPMIVALTAITLAASTRRWRWLLSLRPLLGVVVIALIVGPWVALVAREVGWQNYLSIIADETLGRSVSSAEGHWGPPGYHLLLLPVLFWPGSMLTAAGIALAWKRIRSGSRDRWSRFSAERPAELFLLAWLIPSWLVFEVISTKLPHYTLPLYPALAILSARAVCFTVTRPDGPALLGLNRRPARIGLALWIIIGVLIASTAPTVLARLGGFVATTPWKIIMGAAVGVGAALIISAARSLSKRRYLLAQSLAVIASIIASATTFGLVLPRLNALWISSRLVSAIDSIDAHATRPLAAVGYHEDSLTFLTHARVTRLRFDALPGWLASHGNGLVILPTTRVEAAEELLGRPLTILRRTTGFNYSKGEWADLVIAETAPIPAAPAG